MMNRRNIIALIFFIIGTAFLIGGIMKGNLSLISGFGIFLCLDCIGIS